MRHLTTFACATALAALAACSSGTTDLPTTDTSSRELDASMEFGIPGLNPRGLTLEKIGEFQGGGTGAAEITAYDARSQRLFVVNGALGTVDVLDLANPAAPVKVGTLTAAPFGSGVNSVDVHDGLVALAIEATNRQAAGTVAFHDAKTLELVSSVPVGALPDMLTFTRDGRYVLVANEGEPDATYTNDPEGSVSIIELKGRRAPTVRTATFTRFNGQEAALRQQGIRIYGPNATAAQDFEPEYITTDARGTTAWVTLQENNAVAEVDIRRATVTRVLPLGYKNHNVAGQGLDASDRDGPGNTALINIRPRPVFGMYQPDAIASYEIFGRTFLVTANEGDAREYTAFAEEARAGSLSLNPAIFTTEACGGVACTSNAALGRLTVTRALGRNTATGQYDTLFALGGRSFSIWSEDGGLVWDSGDQLEQRTTALPNVAFNANNAANTNALDDRSDNKGPEPEGVVVGRFGLRHYAFIGLERVGGVMVYDVTRPRSPSFVTYLNPRTGGTGDLGPEGLTLVPARQSPNGKPLLIVGNEISGTTAVLQINLQ